MLMSHFLYKLNATFIFNVIFAVFLYLISYLHIYLCLVFFLFLFFCSFSLYCAHWKGLIKVCCQAPNLSISHCYVPGLAVSLGVSRYSQCVLMHPLQYSMYATEAGPV